MVLKAFKAPVAPLFVPANRPDRFPKAAASAADAIILDLEDAVADAEKNDARAALNTNFTDKPVIVRINAAGTIAHMDDIRALAHLQVAAIMVPKAEREADLAHLAASFPIIALIETVQGVANARALSRCGAITQIAFGSVDYAADLGCAHERVALAAARAEIIFASRLAGLPAPLDGVTTDVIDMQTTVADAVHAAAIGFGGKLAIHPHQVGSILSSFYPDEAQLEWATAILASGDGVTTVNGEMVDEPVRARARSIVARSSTPL
ncbi:CoA ester lyase (plasmid) [Rhizorhabdus wittichii DC-6]|nr:CoA ester lyase [Rhizorhabdus wittichii DC-6]